MHCRNRQPGTFRDISRDRGRAEAHLQQELESVAAIFTMVVAGFPFALQKVEGFLPVDGGRRLESVASFILGILFWIQLFFLSKKVLNISMGI